ncbi:MAG: phage baseplate assembly protein V [bacterium]
MNMECPPLYGKYRGVVTNNDDRKDGKKMGRIRAKVPDVFGEDESGWAMPCVPYAGKGVGFFMIPPVDALVWIEFENGDPEYPIWTGCFWAEDEVPVKSYTPDAKVLKTETATITINDASGNAGITIETKKGMKIVINNDGIEINNGQEATVKLKGKKVSVNGTALEVE